MFHTITFSIDFIYVKNFFHNIWKKIFMLMKKDFHIL